MIAIGIQVTYFGMFWEGFEGMPRRVAFYDPTFLPANDMATGGAYLLMLGWIVLLYAGIHVVAQRHARPGQPVARQDARVEGTHAGPAGELPGRSGGHLRPLRLRRAGPGGPGGHPASPIRIESWCPTSRVTNHWRGGASSGHHHRSARSRAGSSRRSPATTRPRAAPLQRAPGRLAVHQRRRRVPPHGAVLLVLPARPQHRRDVARGRLLQGQSVHRRTRQSHHPRDRQGQPLVHGQHRHPGGDRRRSDLGDRAAVPAPEPGRRHQRGRRPRAGGAAGRRRGPVLSSSGTCPSPPSTGPTPPPSSSSWARPWPTSVC